MTENHLLIYIKIRVVITFIRRSLLAGTLFELFFLSISVLIFVFHEFLFFYWFSEFNRKYKEISGLPQIYIFYRKKKFTCHTTYTIILPIIIFNFFQLKITESLNQYIFMDDFERLFSECKANFHSVYLSY